MQFCGTDVAVSCRDMPPFSDCAGWVALWGRNAKTEPMHVPADTHKERTTGYATLSHGILPLLLSKFIGILPNRINQCVNPYKAVITYSTAHTYITEAFTSSRHLGLAQSVERLATGSTVRGSDAGEDEIFRTRPDRPWGPTSLLYNGYRVFFLGVKRPGRGVNQTPSSSAEVKERVELYLYYSSESSEPVVGQTLPLPFSFLMFVIPSCWSRNWGV